MTTDRQRLRPRGGTFVSLLLCLMLLVAASTSVAAARQASPPAGAAAVDASGEVTLYTSVPQELIDGVKEVFEQTYPDVTLNVYRAGTGEVLARIQAETEAGATDTADVLWVADFTAAANLKEQDLLQAYESPEGEAIPENLKDPEGFFYGSRLINVVPIYNTNNVPEAPTTWNAFLDPAHEGRIAIPSVTASGAAFYAVGTMVNHPDFGWEFFEAMRDNGGIQVANNGDAVSRVASGELDMAFGLDYMVRAQAEDGAPIAYAEPEEGIIMVASPVALMAGAQNPDAAKVFIEWVLSEAGQRHMAETGVVPVRQGLEIEGIPTLDEIEAMESDAGVIGEQEAEIKERFGELFEG
ncbi:MAG: ABC transporter substrate-binding protein [Thermomicrobiales bacterium]